MKYVFKNLSSRFGAVCEAAAVVISLVISVRPSVRLPAENGTTPIGQIFGNSKLVFVPKFVDTYSLRFKSDRKNILHEDVPTFMWSF